MRNITYILLLTLVLGACNTEGNHFKLEGRMRNMNQGEFYIYSLDESVNGIDTIKVNGGKLAYEIPCTHPGILMLVFPNFSEQPVFSEPGKSVKLKADASHLKELEITGTDENELMNDFRKQIANASPPEILKYAEQFIKDHPTSPISNYLVRKYFIVSAKPDYKKAGILLELMRKENPGNRDITRLSAQLKPLVKVAIGSQLPDFTAYDINGRLVSKSSLSAPVALINTWATWNYESQSFQRQLKDYVKRSKGRLKAVSICVDPYKKTCRNFLKSDSLDTWPTICDEQMLESPLLKKLGLYTIPGNILLRNGKIIARDLKLEDLQKRLEDLI